MPLDISDTIYVNATRTLVQKLQEHPMYGQCVQKTIDEIFEYSEDVHHSLTSLLQECERKKHTDLERNRMTVEAEAGAR